jgi:solute carrier family 35 protein E1
MAKSGEPAMASGPSTGMILVYFGIWYVINVAYNYTNKKALQALPTPYLVAAVQIGAGILYVVPIWLLGIRAPPKLEMKELLALIPVGMIHGIGQLVTVLSLGAGSISFVNVVKSLEPFFAIIFVRRARAACPNARAACSEPVVS